MAGHRPFSVDLLVSAIVALAAVPLGASTPFDAEAVQRSAEGAALDAVPRASTQAAAAATMTLEFAQAAQEYQQRMADDPSDPPQAVVVYTGEPQPMGDSTTRWLLSGGYVRLQVPPAGIDAVTGDYGGCETAFIVQTPTCTRAVCGGITIVAAEEYREHAPALADLRDVPGSRWGAKMTESSCYFQVAAGMYLMSTYRGLYWQVNDLLPGTHYYFQAWVEMEDGRMILGTINDLMTTGDDVLDCGTPLPQLECSHYTSASRDDRVYTTGLFQRTTPNGLATASVLAPASQTMNVFVTWSPGVMHGNEMTRIDLYIMAVDKYLAAVAEAPGQFTRLDRLDPASRYAVGTETLDPHGLWPAFHGDQVTFRIAMSDFEPGTPYLVQAVGVAADWRSAGELVPWIPPVV